MNEEISELIDDALSIKLHQRITRTSGWRLRKAIGTTIEKLREELCVIERPSAYEVEDYADALRETCGLCHSLREQILAEIKTAANE